MSSSCALQVPGGREGSSEHSSQDGACHFSCLGCLEGEIACKPGLKVFRRLQASGALDITLQVTISMGSAGLQEASKRPDSLRRHMPAWSWEEIQAARQHIFSRHPETDVASRYSKWGGIPRYVLQKTDAADQDLLQKALNCCSLDNVTCGMESISRASDFTHFLLHLTVEAGYLAGPVVFASDWVQGEVISRCLKFRRDDLRHFVAGSWGEPTIAAFRGALWESYAHAALQCGGSFSCRDLQDAGADPFEIELQPGSSSVGLWDLQDITTELGSGVDRWGRSENLPEFYAVVQPDKLFQITVSGDPRVKAKGLANAVRAMRAKERAVQLFFVVPPHVFSSYTTQTLKQTGGDLAAENVAGAGKQFVLKVGV